MSVAAATPNQISLRVPLTNSVTGLAGVPAGGTVLIATAGFDPTTLPGVLTGWTLFIGGQTVAFTTDKTGVLTATVPVSLTVGPQVVQLSAPASLPGISVPPVVLQLDSPPPAILSAADLTTSAAGDVPVTAAAPAKPGDLVALTVAAVADVNGVLPGSGAVWVSVNGLNYPAVSVAPLPALAGSSLIRSQVEFVLPASLTIDPAATAPTATIMVGTGTRLSAGYALNITSPPAPAP